MVAERKEHRIPYKTFYYVRWRKRRMTLFQRYGIPGPKPNFLFGNIKEFNKGMSSLMSRPIKIFLSNVDKQGNHPFNTVSLCKKLVFDIICTTAFGITTNVQNDETNKFIESVHAAFSVDSTDILAGITICFPEVEPVCSFIRYKIDTLKYVLNLPCFTVIYETCKEMVISRKKSDQHPHDLLQAIIDAEDENGGGMKKLPDNLVIGIAIMFMAVGYDTTSTTLEWSIYHLARNPDLQQKVREEIKMNVSDDMEIQYSDLCKFQLLNQVIAETLRFWPFSFLVLNRVCADDYHCKDFTIPKGAILAVPVQVLQKDPAYWSEPDKFNPYRFSSEERKPIDSIVYQPFGAGQRICMGQRLAKTILILTLSNLLRSFKLEFRGDDKMEILHTLFFTYPKNGIIIKAITLNSSN
ncbi:cytochrome P450 3A21-like [Centruroides sculpturatus]|uniref:cytochrome P450 3A21-like n=1 Tax=Centruroides sculpturatus TaxID=218467 RepID=UPI000C6CBAA4|nr:cytochrome P450 3A21-like [Centruroides sculpturatus]